MEKVFVYIKPKGGVFLSPFLLNKYLDHNVGRIDYAKNTPDGFLTKLTQKDIEKIKKNNKINDVELEISYNERLNTSKGVIYYPQFKYLDDKIILEELAQQGVISITRFLKKGVNNGASQEKGTVEGKVNTGLFMLTFNKPNKPFNLNICYEKIDIKTYYPNPMRCNSCHNFGHKTATCRSPKICGSCAKPEHGECKELYCKHCNGSHPAWDRKCPTYQHEVDIIKYAIDNNIPFKQARINKQTNTRISTFADAVKKDQDIQEIKEMNKKLQETINKMQETINKQQEFINQTFTQQSFTPMTPTITPMEPTSATITETSINNTINRPMIQPAQDHLIKFQQRLEEEALTAQLATELEMEIDEPGHPPNKAKRQKTTQPNKGKEKPILIPK